MPVIYIYVIRWECVVGEFIFTFFLSLTHTPTSFTCMQFLLFELIELQNSHSSPSIISWLVERCNQVGLDLIPFAKQAISQS